MFSFSFLSTSPLPFSSFLRISIYDHVTERIIASNNEQRKETPKARKRYNAILPHNKLSPKYSIPSLIGVRTESKITKSIPSLEKL